MTTSVIETPIHDINGVEIADTTVSRITDKSLPIVQKWQQKTLERIYVVVSMGAIHYHVRSEGQIIKKAVYIAIAINLEDRKDILSIWGGENWGDKYRTTVRSGLKTVERTTFSLPAWTIWLGFQMQPMRCSHERTFETAPFISCEIPQVRIQYRI